MISDEVLMDFLKCENIRRRGELHYEAGHVERFQHEGSLIVAKVLSFFVLFVSWSENAFR